jgi:hypothetical protein
VSLFLWNIVFLFISYENEVKYIDLRRKIMFRICSEFSVMFRICSEFSAMFRICSEFSAIFRIFRICSEFTVSLFLWNIVFLFISFVTVTTKSRDSE